VSTYRASVRVDDGTLHTSRPLTAPEFVRDLVDSVVYDVTQPERAGQLTSVELVFETPDESDTPIGDGITATSSAPLGAHEAPEDDDVLDLEAPATVVQ
jgi:hypothetical protein